MAQQKINSGQIATQQAWQTLTLTNGTGTAQYFKDSLGIVHLQGTINVTGTFVDLFTLPSGYRPALAHEMPVTSAGGYGQVLIATTGVLSKQVGGNGNLDISVLTFRADGS